VASLQEGLTLLLSSQALPAETAAALKAALCKGGALGSEQLATAGGEAAAASIEADGRGDDLEEVISAINKVSAAGSSSQQCCKRVAAGFPVFTVSARFHAEEVGFQGCARGLAR
jgi:hypothetical protein